jgi:hypothetical protein
VTPCSLLLLAGCEGIAAINTIRSVMGVNLDTLRPEPSVEGYTTPGGYSYRAVKPIALERVMSISRMLQESGFQEKGVSVSGIGGVETGGDAAEFILLGSDTVQVGTAVSGQQGSGGKVEGAPVMCLVMATLGTSCHNCEPFRCVCLCASNRCVVTVQCNTWGFLLPDV